MLLKSSPQRENNLKTTLNLPKTPTLFYSLRRQPNRNISALTQSSQAARRSSTNVSDSLAINLDSDYGRPTDMQVLEVSQRPIVKRDIESRKKSEISRTKQLFKTLEQTPQNRPNLSQLDKMDSGSLEAAPCPTCENSKKQIQSMTREIDELQDLISGMLRDQTNLGLDLKKAKILLRETKVAKDNQSIKRSHVTENLELKVKLLQDSLTQRNLQLLEQEKQNQTLIQILDQYETKMELANEQLQAKEVSNSENQLDLTSIQGLISFHQEKVLKLRQLKVKHKRIAKQEASTQVQMICQQSQESIDNNQSDYRQSQKSIHESNYSSEPLLENVKFN